MPPVRAPVAAPSVEPTTRFRRLPLPFGGFAFGGHLFHAGMSIGQGVFTALLTAFGKSVHRVGSGGGDAHA